MKRRESPMVFIKQVEIRIDEDSNHQRRDIHGNSGR